MGILSRIILVFVLLQSVQLQAQTFENGRLEQVKRDTALFSKIVAEVLKQNFDNPFAISMDPQGSFLEGYGVSISFLLRINRGSIRGIYGEVMAGERDESSLSRGEKLALVKKLMVRTLVDYGGTIKGLEDHEKVAISAHVEDRSEWDPASKMTIIVVSGTKKEINQLSRDNLPYEELLERLNILEY